MTTKFFLSAGLLSCFSSLSHAAVLLEKISYPGYTLYEYASAKKCQIQDDGKMQIQHELGGMTSNSTTPLRLSLTRINQTIAAATSGRITHENWYVDGPTYIYRAYLRKADGTVKSILLYEENGGRGSKTTNQSQAARLLSNFIDLNCGDPFHQ
jgi:hypothetical protein